LSPLVPLLPAAEGGKKDVATALDQKRYTLPDLAQKLYNKVSSIADDGDALSLKWENIELNLS